MVEILVAFGFRPNYSYKNTGWVGVVYNNNNLKTIKEYQKTFDRCMISIGFSSYAEYLDTYPGLAGSKPIREALKIPRPNIYYMPTLPDRYISPDTDDYDGRDIDDAADFIEKIAEAVKQKSLFVTISFKDVDRHHIMSNYFDCDRLWFCSDWKEGD